MAWSVPPYPTTTFIYDPPRTVAFRGIDDWARRALLHVTLLPTFIHSHWLGPRRHLPTLIHAVVLPTYTAPSFSMTRPDLLLAFCFRLLGYSHHFHGGMCGNPGIEGTIIDLLLRSVPSCISYAFAFAVGLRALVV